MIFTLLYVLHSVGQYLMDKLKETIVEAEDGNEETVPTNIGYGRRNSVSSDEEEKIKFTPTASVQRYRAVERILRRPEFNIQKVVEFGCANLRFVKNIKNAWSIQQAVFVDLDKQVLFDNQQKIEPRWEDYKSLRQGPLEMAIYKGSVTQYHKILDDTDAVVCIELIEHLYMPDVERMTTNIFQNIQPKVVVITTPNKDFNVIFKMKDTEMRHWDHKFEWTRQEFNDWADRVVQKYPVYEVETECIIDGPNGTQYLGGCSQMAVFTRINDQKNSVTVPHGDYSLIKRITNFPYYTDELFCEYVLDFIGNLRREMEACGKQTTFIVNAEQRSNSARVQYRPVDFYEFKGGIGHKISNAKIKQLFQMMDIGIIWKPNVKEILFPYVDEDVNECVNGEQFVQDNMPVLEEPWEDTYDDRFNVDYTQAPPRDTRSDDGYIDEEGDFEYVVADKPVRPAPTYPARMGSPAVDDASVLHKSVNLKRTISLEKTDSLPSIYSFNLEKSSERSLTSNEVDPFLQPAATPSPAQKKPRLKDLEGFSFRDAIDQYNQRNGIPPFVLSSPQQSSTPKAFRLVKDNESQTKNGDQSIRSDKSSDSIKLEDLSDGRDQKVTSSFYESAVEETLKSDQIDSDQLDSDATFQS